MCWGYVARVRATVYFPISYTIYYSVIGSTSGYEYSCYANKTLSSWEAYNVYNSNPNQIGEVNWISIGV